ncbi:hypothetical protein HAX54_012552, partial [Datura stramonium]|nr:hypothetical protein [Datura stramonium]
CCIAHANAPGRKLLQPAIPQGRSCCSLAAVLGQGCLTHVIAPRRGLLRARHSAKSACALHILWRRFAAGSRGLCHPRVV